MENRTGFGMNQYQLVGIRSCKLLNCSTWTFPPSKMGITRALPQGCHKGEKNMAYVKVLVHCKYSANRSLYHWGFTVAAWGMFCFRKDGSGILHGGLGDPI